MSLGDIAAAMSGLSAGAANWQSNKRAQQVENEEFAQLQARGDRYEAMTPLEIQQAENRNRISSTQARSAEETVQGRIDTTNAQNDDLLAKHRRRIESGVPEAEAMADLSAADRELVTNALASEKAEAEMKAGTPEAQARANVAQANASESSANRSVERDAIAKSIGLDRTTAWAEQSSASRSATEDRRAREDLVTDEMNGVYANNAIARKSAAQSARRMAEVQSELTKARQNSGFDMIKFGRENADTIMGAAVDAAYMAGIGGDAAAAALPLINMDANGDGQLDYAGATSTAIRNIDGKNYLVAIDDNGEIVPSSTAPDTPGMEVAELANWHASRKGGAGKASGKEGSKKKAVPVKLSEVDDLDDLSFDMLGGAFGAKMEDTNDDGVDDTFASLEGAVPPGSEAGSESQMVQLQTHVSAYLSQAQANGGGIAEARIAISTPEKMARNLYGANDAALTAAQKMAQTNARTHTIEKMRADGQDIDPSATIEPDKALVTQHLNKILISMMSQAAPQL